MELPIQNPDIIDLVLIYIAPETLPPYGVVVLIAALFGVACWFASISLKHLRFNEAKLKRENLKLTRQVERLTKMLQKE